MAIAARRLFRGGALPLGCALAVLWPQGAGASDLRLFTADTIHGSGDIRLVGVDGERSWVDGGLGKLRSGSSGDFRVHPQLGNLALVWQPQFTWSLSATIVGAIQGGERTQAGAREVYLSFRPMRSSSGTALSARAGLMWPPVSLEHSGADWRVTDSITPSAINSWIGEEVRPVAIEGTIATPLGSSQVRATAALFAANDTSGTLLTFRGWALHDRTTLAFDRQPLPPLGQPLASLQAPFTHPLLDVGSGFARRPGYYVKLTFAPAAPLRVELFRYDNRANPEAVNTDLEWGWHTVFDDAGLVARLGGVTLKAQALQGRTRMGYPEAGRRWIDDHFRSAFVLASAPLGSVVVSTRVEGFATRNRGSIVGHDYNERGWSAMIAARRDWRRWTGLVELLHVSSRREDREDMGLAPRQDQTQLQAEVRTGW